jgi:hypothetical protein
LEQARNQKEREKTGDFLPTNSHEMELTLEAEEGDLNCVAVFFLICCDRSILFLCSSTAEKEATRSGHGGH